MGIIGSSKLMGRTGASRRQVDYWSREGIIPIAGEYAPGSGNSKEFDEDIVDRVIVLVRISKAFFRFRFPGAGLLRLIYEHYDDGFIDIGDNIKLSWK